VELPYSGGTTSMVTVLPHAGAREAVEQGLSGDFFASVTGALAYASVQLTMPRFKIHGGSVSLARELQALGMKAAFDPHAANFTAMIPAGGTFISDVIHQAFVDVDESGTEAAAATAVIGDTAAIVEPSVTVTADHPFLFFIRDVATNTILFVGREGDPSAE
jgi:serpin B